MPSFYRANNATYVNVCNESHTAALAYDVKVRFGPKVTMTGMGIGPNAAVAKTCQEGLEPDIRRANRQ